MTDDQMFILAGKVMVSACALLGALRAIALAMQVVTWLKTGHWVPYR